LNYTFPLSYPDWELGGWLYVKRLHAKLFFNWGYLPDTNWYLHVLGIDFLRYIPIFEINVRYVRKLEKEKGKFSLLLSWGLIYK
jgi:hypothetical protein